MKTTQKRMGFTLIELLVVIAIIAILAAILFPVFAQARMAAKKTSTVAQMKQQALSVIMYMDDSDDIAPPRYRYDFTGTPGNVIFSWDRLVQPYTKNYQIFTSTEDTRPRYAVPYAGQYRRSFAGAANIFIAIQRGTLNSKTSRVGTSVPQPADTVMLGMKFMNHRTIPNYWDAELWAAEAIIYNTRNAQLPITDPRAQYGEIQNVYGGASVWAFMDSHVKVVRAGGFALATQTGASTTVPHGTLFPGYEERAGSWVGAGSISPFWDRGIACMEAEVSPTSTNKDCPLPGDM